MILFQAQIEEHQKLAEHYRELAAKREALAAGLLAFQQQADSDLSSLRLLVDKCKEVAPNAIASLKSAVLTLFDSNDDGNDSGNQPTDPTPDLDDEKEHEQKTQTDCGFDIDPTPKPALDPQLDGQHCQLTSPLASLLWEDAPLLGQCCTVEVSQTQSEKTSYTEFARVTDRVGYIKVNNTGEIKSVYVGFNNKTRAKAWAKYLEIVTPKIELRPAKRVGDWKHEVKLSGLSLKQIERLAAEDLDKMPPAKEPSLPPSYKPRSIAQPVNPDEVGEGDVVTALLTPGGSYKVIQVMPNGILDCENMTTGTRLGLRPNAVSLVQKAEKPQPTEPIEFNDLVEVVADGNDAVGLVGAFGRVKIIKGDRIGIEIDEQLAYFNKAELKLKAKAEAAPQTTGLQSGQLLMGSRIVTTGNYTGLARRSSILNTRMGTADKVAALELVKAGLSPELAMAAATGTADTDYDF
jgi:hypothetical protein